MRGSRGTNGLENRLRSVHRSVARAISQTACPFGVAVFGCHSPAWWTSANDSELGSGQIQIWINNHEGTFHLAEAWTEGSEPLSVATGDLNKDGRADFMVADFDLGYFVPFYGDGNLGFTRGLQTPTLAPIYLALADLNLDGKPDVLVSNLYAQQVSVFLASDGGRYRTAPRVPVGNQPWQIAVADFTHTGQPGFGVANGNDGTVSVFAGNGGGGFSSLGTYSMSASVPGFSEDLESVVAVDLNGDGRVGLGATNAGDAGTILVRLANRI